MKMQNLTVFDSDGKTASEYKQFDCLGTYDTLSEIGNRKREFAWRGAELKMRLIVLRACTCGVILRRGEGGPGGEGPGGRSGVRPHGPGTEPLSGDSSAAHRGTIRCNFTTAPQAGKERFFCLFQIIFFPFYHLYFRAIVVPYENSKIW